MTTSSPGGEGTYHQIERGQFRRLGRGEPLAHVTRCLHDGVRSLLDELQLRGGDRLLDFGCADQPYRTWLPPDVVYLGADLVGNPAAEVVVSPDGRVDVEDSSIHAVLSTQVLEHVATPAAYLEEAFRVLADGGRLGLTTHGLMRLHRDPIDLWRWTSDGLAHQVILAGFRVERAWGIIGPAAAGIQLFQDATARGIPAPLRRPYISILQHAASWVDRRTPQSHKDLDAMVFAIVAAKPGRKGDHDAGRVT